MEEGFEKERRFAPFFLSFFITLLIMTGVLAGVLLLGDFTAAASVQESPEQPAAFRLPRREERLILLLAGAENEKTAPDVYLLAGFLPDKGKIAICLLPPKTMITAGDQWGTLDELFARGGVGYAAKVAGSYLGIPIGRSGYMEVRQLDRWMEKAGFFEYNSPVELDYPLHQRQVVMGRGPQQLDGRAMADVLAYPAYKGGEAERSDRGAMLVTQLLNHHLPACLTTHGDSLVKSFLNNCQTDLSYMDYEERKTSLRFLAQLSLPAVTAVYVEGSLSRDYSSFLLTESCRARLQSVYNGDGFAQTPKGITTPDARLGAYEPVEEPKP